MMRELSTTDLKILALLRADARMTVAAIAHHTGVSRATVKNRIERLETDGVISGYTVRINTPAPAHLIRAMMNIAIDSNRSREVIEILRHDPGVQRLHTTNGRWDMIAELQLDSLEAFDRALERIRLTSGISTTETNILLTTYKS